MPVLGLAAPAPATAAAYATSPSGIAARVSQWAVETDAGQSDRLLLTVAGAASALVQAIDVLGQPLDVLVVAVRADAVGLVVDFDPDRLLFRLLSAHYECLPMASATSPSMIVMASSIASTFN